MTQTEIPHNDMLTLLPRLAVDPLATVRSPCTRFGLLFKQCCINCGLLFKLVLPKSADIFKILGVWTCLTKNTRVPRFIKELRKLCYTHKLLWTQLSSETAGASLQKRAWNAPRQEVLHKTLVDQTTCRVNKLLWTRQALVDTYASCCGHVNKLL